MTYTVYNGYIIDDIYIAGSLRPYTDQNSGSYIRSPSGTYTAFLTPDVRFAVAQGSTPNNTPQSIIWQTPVLNNISSSPAAAANLFPDGQLLLYDENAQQLPVYIVNEGSHDYSGATMSLSDSGKLTINQGHPGSIGAEIWNNSTSDPVVSIGLTNINYDLAHPTNTKINQVAVASNQLVNNTGQTQQIATSLTLSYTKTSSWNFGVSDSIALGVKSATSVNVPGVGSVSAELSLTSTTTISGGKGGSDTFATSFSAGVPANVLPFSTYQTKLTGTAESFDVPYTWDGIATYSNGATGAVSGTGVFTGADTGVFKTEVDCISTPGGCPSGPVSEELVGGGGLGSGVPIGVPSPIPEPASLPLLPAALLATAVIRRLRTRSGRRAGPRGGALRGARGQAGLAV